MLECWRHPPTGTETDQLLSVACVRPSIGRVLGCGLGCIDRPVLASVYHCFTFLY